MGNVPLSQPHGDQTLVIHEFLVGALACPFPGLPSPPCQAASALGSCLPCPPDSDVPRLELAPRPGHREVPEECIRGAPAAPPRQTLPLSSVQHRVWPDSALQGRNFPSPVTHHVGHQGPYSLWHRAPGLSPLRTAGKDPRSGQVSTSNSPASWVGRWLKVLGVRSWV